MKRQTKTVTKTERKTQSELMAARVALHPFLAGMSRTHLALLTDCAIAAHFEKGQTILRKGEFAKGFYLIESGEVVLESGEESGEPVVVDTIRSGGFAWLVVDVPAVRLAVHGDARSNPLTPSFSMGQLCGNIAKRTTR